MASSIHNTDTVSAAADSSDNPPMAYQSPYPVKINTNAIVNSERDVLYTNPATSMVPPNQYPFVRGFGQYNQNLNGHYHYSPYYNSVPHSQYVQQEYSMSPNSTRYRPYLNMSNQASVITSNLLQNNTPVMANSLQNQPKVVENHIYRQQIKQKPDHLDLDAHSRLSSIPKPMMWPHSLNMYPPIISSHLNSFNIPIRPEYLPPPSFYNSYYGIDRQTNQQDNRLQNKENNGNTLNSDFSSGPKVPPNVNIGISNKEKLPRMYNCNICQKWFTSSGFLKRHLHSIVHKLEVMTSAQLNPAIKLNNIAKDTTSHQSEYIVPDVSCVENNLKEVKNTAMPSNENSSGSKVSVHANIVLHPSTMEQHKIPAQVETDIQQQPIQSSLIDKEYSKNIIHITKNIPAQYYPVSLTQEPPRDTYYTIINHTGDLEFNTESKKINYFDISTYASDDYGDQSMSNEESSSSSPRPTDEVSPKAQTTLSMSNERSSPSLSKPIDKISTLAHTIVSITDESNESMSNQSSSPSLPKTIDEISTLAQTIVPITDESFESMSNQSSYPSLPKPIDEISTLAQTIVPITDESFESMTKERTLSISPRAIDTTSPLASTFAVSPMHTYAQPYSPSISMYTDVPERIYRHPTSESDQHKCFDCNKLFSKACYLYQHNQAIHSGVQPFKCPICGKQFARVEQYEVHLTKHGSDKPFKCDKCVKQFNYKADLRRHELSHNAQKPHTCEICGKSFIRRDNLIKHGESHRRKLASLAYRRLKLD